VLVGAVDITVLHRGPLQLGNLGYRVFRPYRRRGYAKEAVSAAMHFAFERLQLNRLEAVLDRENRPSRALARTLGMTRECIRRRYYFDGGRFVDQEVWSAQREDFGHPPLQRVRG
jgi:RimJ/RimL family protein N-acetyltransferase